MKNIAILVYDLTNEYNITVVDGIVNFFNNKPDYRIFISSVNLPHADTNVYDYQYWTLVELLKTNDIDGIIVVTNSFLNKVTIEELSKALKCFAKIPVFSVGVSLNLSNFYYTEVSCVDAYDRIINHLVNKHNRRKIAFFTASLTNSMDSEIRFNVYKSTLEKYGVEFNPDFVLHGDFSPLKAHDVVKEKYKTKDDIKFDAILCVNDYTALGCIGALQEYGLNIPNDICVFGFDDANVAVSFNPTISTVTQNVKQTGEKTAEIAYKFLSGEEISKKTVIESSPIYRQSCGCIDPKLKINAFYDKDDVYNANQESITDLMVNGAENFFDEMVNIYHLLNLTDTVTSINNFFKSTKNLLQSLYIKGIAVCLYPNKIELKQKDEFILPEEANLIMYIDDNSGKAENFWDKEGIKFNPRESILPKQLNLFSNGTFFLVPIFLQDMNYGYIVGKSNLRLYLFHSVFYKILISAFIHAYEYSLSERENENLKENNMELSIQSKTDELTKILNRRGFLSYGQQMINLSLVNKKNGFVFFCDLDGLKTINDTYGHKVGDLAIQSEAEVLKKAFHVSDIVGRLSGDEFGIIAPGFKFKKFGELREKIDKLNEDISKKNNFQFKLSISVGYAEFSEEASDLQKVLRLADEKLYEEKNEKHSKRK